MKYKMKVGSSDVWYFFEYKHIKGYYGERFLVVWNDDGSTKINETFGLGINDGAEFISNRAMFKLAVLNNFLDKLKEMCSTDLNQKQ